MIEVHLYGRLRQYGPTREVTATCVLHAEPKAEHRTVGELVEWLGIPPQEVASVFRDGRWQRGGLDTTLGEARRLGLFPANMNMLYV